MLFETKRLKIRHFTIEDAPAVFEFGSNEDVNKMTGDKVLTSIEEAEEIIRETWLPEYEKYGYARMAVVHKKDKRVIGFSGLKFETHFSETDIGYRFLPQYWGKGIATEASLPFIFYGFKVLKLPKIVGVAQTENIASEKVLQNLGLIRNKKLDFEDEGKPCLWYELTQEQYMQHAQPLKAKKKR